MPTGLGRKGEGNAPSGFLVATATESVFGHQALPQSPHRGGTLTMILQPEPAILNLGINQQTPVAIVATKVTRSLLRYGFDLLPMPSLAKAWEMSPDGLTRTFHLYDDVYWHRGERLAPMMCSSTCTSSCPPCIRGAA